jgi:hypothetical protein
MILMALTLETQTTATLSLEEFLDQISRELDPRDPESLAAQAEKLRALANNRHFLTERLNQELRDWRTFQEGNSYIGPALVLGRGPGWMVRANVWAVPSQLPEQPEWLDDYFFYLQPHDHAFPFLTVGYLGSGYETVIYEVDPEEITGFPGERVQLRFLERTTLPRGKVMLYRTGRDVHRQEHPREFSISLNLMAAAPEGTNQHTFNLETGEVLHSPQNKSSARALLCRMAQHLGDGTTAALLEQLTGRHPSARLRSLAYEALAALVPGETNALWARARADAHEQVRRQAELALASLP